jgi:hypothetical protein
VEVGILDMTQSVEDQIRRDGRGHGGGKIEPGGSLGSGEFGGGMNWEV